MHAVTQSCDRPVWNEQLNYVLVLFLAELSDTVDVNIGLKKFRKRTCFGHSA
jgi:hypothetical protein